MNAAVLYALGETPRAAQFPEPVPADGELLIQVKAAALKLAAVPTTFVRLSGCVAVCHCASVDST